MTPPTSTDSRRAHVCLGSNIRPTEYLPRAVRALAREVTVVAVSRVYESEAKGARETPRFLNAAVTVETDLSPRALKFDVLRRLEGQLGRVRTLDPNEPRTIDLDLVLFGDLVVDDTEAGLVLPDPDILRFAHVALPLADVDPGLRHPLSGETLGTIARRLRAESDIRRVDRPVLTVSTAGSDNPR